jgi:gamma-glutamyltranspeptidase / glutathione hydrolase
VKRALAIALIALPAFAGSTVTAKSAALATAHPTATQIGLAVLRNGGNAADAAVAVAFALAVVHPQAGNLGGGGFLTYYDAQTKGVWTLDFSAIAPLATKPDMFATDRDAARTGPLAAAVPGTVAGLDALYRRFGSKPWKSLVEPSARVAREGIRLDAELTAELLAAKTDRKIDRYPPTSKIFFTDEKTTLVQIELATTLQRIADAGAKDFYEGELAKKFVEALRANAGNIGYRDLRDYAPAWRAPIKLRFGDYDIYTVAPPSGGGLVIGEALNILSGFDLAAAGYQSPRMLHLFIEAARRAYVDRNRYVADPITARIPYRDLLSPERAAVWRKSIDPQRVTITSLLPDIATPRPEGEHTTHFTIADAQGNVAAVTVTLGENFGSGFVIPGLGFFLNNAMADFTIADGQPNGEGLVQSKVNRVEPSKRIASSLAPTIVLKENRPFLALGTRGGATIPTTILQVFLSVVVFGKTLPQAVAAPRWHHQALPEEIDYERGLAPQETVDALNRMGHGVRARESIGDVHAILFRTNGLVAVADPRRGGAAGGY